MEMDNVTRLLSTLTIYSWLLAHHYKSRILCVLVGSNKARDKQWIYQCESLCSKLDKHGPNTLGGILAPPYLGENRLDLIKA